MSSSRRWGLGRVGVLALAVCSVAVPIGVSGAGAQQALPFGLDTNPGVQPGGPLESKGGSCTMNFLFRGADGSRFIGTAGHCILGGGVGLPGGDDEEMDDKSTGPSDKERIWATGDGPEVTGPGGTRIGEFAYAILQDPKDFALIRLDADVEASPAMAYFGGPTGINEDLSQDPVVLQFYGQSPGMGTVLPARSMVAVNMPNPDHAYAMGPGAPGDSGAGVISDDGRAIGVLVTGGTHVGDNDKGAVPEFGDIGITRIGPQMRRAADVLGVALELETVK